jgi:xanthine/uracil permease
MLVGLSWLFNMVDSTVVRVHIIELALRLNQKTTTKYL